MNHWTRAKHTEDLDRAVRSDSRDVVEVAQHRGRGRNHGDQPLRDLPRRLRVVGVNVSMTGAGMPRTIEPRTGRHKATPRPRRVDRHVRELTSSQASAVFAYTSVGPSPAIPPRNSPPVGLCGTLKRSSPVARGSRARGKQPVLDGVSAAWGGVRRKGAGAGHSKGAGSSELHSRSSPAVPSRAPIPVVRLRTRTRYVDPIQAIVVSS